MPENLLATILMLYSLPENLQQYSCSTACQKTVKSNSSPLLPRKYTTTVALPTTSSSRSVNDRHQMQHLFSSMTAPGIEFFDDDTDLGGLVRNTWDSNARTLLEAMMKSCWRQWWNPTGGNDGTLLEAIMEPCWRQWWNPGGGNDGTLLGGNDGPCLEQWWNHAGGNDGSLLEAMMEPC